MGLSPRAGLFGGIALLSAAVALLQIVLLRLFSAMFGHHFGFAALSLSLLGAGIGAALLSAVPALARPPALLARLSVLSCLVSAATIGTILFLVRQKPITALGSADLPRVGLLFLVCSLPFILAGVALAGAIRHAARDMSRLYLADLAAAASGGVSAMLALGIGAPRSVLGVAILAALAGWWFTLPLPRARRAVESPELSPQEPERTAPSSLVATMVLGTAVLFAGDFGAPWLKLNDAREVRLDKVELQKWTLLSLVTVDKPHAGTALLRNDGAAASAILEGKTTPPLRPDEMGYALQKDQGPALVIGPGGGRDVRAALKAGQKQIDAVELDPVVAHEVMGEKYKEFSGDLYGRPEVNVAVADGRAFVRASRAKYRAIVLSLAGDSAAPSPGALALSANSLYTVEAFRDFLEHLAPGGTLTVSRWESEAHRVLALAAAGLHALGIDKPKAHIFACNQDRTTTVLIKREAYLRDEILTLRRHCNKHKLREIFSPDVVRDGLSEQLVAARAGFIAESGNVDLRAPTDDRPFFFHTLPVQAAGKLLASPQTFLQEHQGVALLFGLFALSAVAVGLFLLVPLFARRGPAAAPRARPITFFLSIGAGFVLAAVAVMQQLTLFLGHPAIALTAALAALLVGAGVGSLSTARVSLASAADLAARRAHILVGLLASLAVLLGPVLGRALLLPVPLRTLFAVALLLPIGALMGSLVPLGVRLVERSSARLLPWCWGLHGLAGVTAIAAGMFVAMSFGFSAALLLSGAAYLIASLAVPEAPAEDAEPDSQPAAADLSGPTESPSVHTST